MEWRNRFGKRISFEFQVPDIDENAASGAIQWDYLEGAKRNRVPIAEIQACEIASLAVHSASECAGM